MPELPQKPKRSNVCHTKLDYRTVSQHVPMAQKGIKNLQIHETEHRKGQRKMANKEPKRQAKVSPGTKSAAEMRSVANKLTDDQRDDAMSQAMQIIYGGDKKAGVHAVRH